MAKATLNAYQVIKAPVITEKAAIAGSMSNSAVFQVHPKASKTDIKRAVEKIFDVTVTGVRTVNTMGKLKRVGAKTGRRAAKKKAYVQLAPGSTIDVIEGL